MKRSIWRLFLLFLAILFPKLAHAQPRYSIIDFSNHLPDLIPVDINDRGQLALALNNQTYVWTPTSPNGTVGELQHIPVGFENRVSAINNRAELALFAPLTNGGYVWYPAENNPAEGNVTAVPGAVQAFEINDAGQVLGIANNGQLTLWNPDLASGALQSAMQFPAGGTLDLYGINSIGQVVGENSSHRAFVWTPTAPNGSSGTMVELGVDPAQLSVAVAISDTGSAVGGSADDDDTSSILWIPNSPNGQQGTLTILATSRTTHARDINNRGHVVGMVESIGYLWTAADGRMNLNHLVEPNLHWRIHEPWAINEAGQIIAEAIYLPNGPEGPGQRIVTTVLLNPIPEPSSYIIAALGFGVVCVARWRTRTKQGLLPDMHHHRW